MKKYTLTLLLTAAPLFAGTPAPVAPAPQPNTEQGFTLGLEAMALRPFQSEGAYDQSDYEFGYRGSLGYQFNDGLFIKASYFGYEADVIDYAEVGRNYLYKETGDLEASALDLVVGQIFRPTDTLTLSPYVGLRWATFEEGYSEYDDDDGIDIDSYNNDFEGIGIIVGIDATRALGSNFSIYGTAKQSIVFGTTDISESESYYYGEGTPQVHVDSWSDDTVVSISELGLGVQYDFCFSNVAANVRLGVEGQWWAGLSGDDSENTGLAGFVLGANFRF